MNNTKQGRFASQDVSFANGVTGSPIEIGSANPRNYFQALSKTDEVSETHIDGQLFLPKGRSCSPVVIIVPGSLGVAPSHLAHAETLTDMGIAACVIDPFAARNVTSTVANQTQYSFAASAWDVLATVKYLDQIEEIDSGKISAQGHSRGGSAVLTAASKRFSRIFSDRDHSLPELKAVYAAYPWCGHQFLDPGIGSTEVRAVIGDRDEWCLPQQVQGHIHAIQVAGGSANLKIFAGAHHSFDRGTPIQLIEDASVTPGAPTCYIDESGAFIHPVTGEPDSKLNDRDLMVYALKAGYGVKGARMGSDGDQAEQFRLDMVEFWRGQLLGD